MITTATGLNGDFVKLDNMLIRRDMITWVKKRSLDDKCELYNCDVKLATVECTLEEIENKLSYG